MRTLIKILLLAVCVLFYAGIAFAQPPPFETYQLEVEDTIDVGGPLTSTSNIYATGSIEASGAITTADAFYGDGSHLTGIGVGYWNRIGTELTTTTASDSVQLDGALSIGHNTGTDGYDVNFYGTVLGATGSRMFWDASNGSFSIGNNSVANGPFAFAAGRETIASGDVSTAIGYYSTANNVLSTAIGYSVTAGNAFSMAIGSGVDDSNRLVNNTGSSLMVGFNSDEPTLFVGPSSGVGTTGKVGIATTTTLVDLTVDGDIAAIGTSGNIYASGTYYGDGSNLTGLSSYWDRAGTELTTTTASDSVQIDGTLTVGRNVNANGYDVNFYGDYVSGNVNTRMFWDASKYAFRAGYAAGQWSDTNVGSRSFAVGDYPTAKGYLSFAVGYYPYASGAESVAVGRRATAKGTYSIAFGKWVEAHQEAGITIGEGADFGSRFINNTAHSLMIGFLCDEPTLFVGPSTGTGTTGQVAIGTIDVSNGAALTIGDSTSSYGGISLAFSTEPSDPATDTAMFWVDDGTTSDATGDLRIIINVGGATKAATIVDYSGL